MKGRKEKKIISRYLAADWEFKMRLTTALLVRAHRIGYGFLILYQEDHTKIKSYGIDSYSMNDLIIYTSVCTFLDDGGGCWCHRPTDNWLYEYSLFTLGAQYRTLGLARTIKYLSQVSTTMAGTACWGVPFRTYVVATTRQTPLWKWKKFREGFYCHVGMALTNYTPGALLVSQMKKKFFQV